MTREKFTARHDTLTVNIEHQYPSAMVPRTFCISYSPLPSGRIGEVWVNSVNGTEKQVNDDMRDTCVALSLALQYGSTLEQMSQSILRDNRGRPQGFLGAVLDALRKETAA
jgi:hypothetical protein